MTATIVLPQILHIGGGSRKQLLASVKSLNCSRPMFISDSTMQKLGILDPLAEQLNQDNIPTSRFTNVMPEPDDQSIQQVVEHVRQEKIDCLIAVGGGSAIDSAKAIALLATHGGHIRDYKVPHVINEQSIPVIAIPTTAGTGSECTKVTIISDSASSEKMLCMGPGLMPKVAIVDYELTLTLPYRVAADTGIDALTHAIEAYISKKANAFSDQQAIAAMGMIAKNLIEACKNPKNLEAKEAMMLGSFLAGMAFSNASVALVHGMSRPLGVHFHVPHGMSNAMLLPCVTQFSLPDAPQRYAQCAVHMGLNVEPNNIESCHQALITFLNELNMSLDVPSMSSFGIEKQQYNELIPTMAKQAIASGSPGNNPRTPSEDEIINLYQTVYA